MPSAFDWSLLEDRTTTTVTRSPAESREAVGERTIRNFLLDEDGDLLIHRFATGVVAVQQSIRCRLQAFRGEWFLNLNLGLPYLQEIIGRKSPNLIAIRALYRQVIEETPGVRELLELRLALSADRVLTVTFKVNTDFGELLDSVPIQEAA